MKQPIKMTPGDDTHLSLLMEPFSLNLFTGQDRQHLLGYGRAAFAAGHAQLRASTPEAAEELIEEIIERISDHAVKVVSHHEARKQGDADQIESARQAVFQADDWIKRDLRILAALVAAAAVAVPDEREAFERELIDNHHYVPSDFSFKDGFYGGDDDYIQFGWDVWQARAALAATPADHIADAGKMVAAASRTTGYVAPKGRYVPPVLFSPYTGEPRDARDIASDPQGVLIVPPGALLTASSKPAAETVVLPEPFTTLVRKTSWSSDCYEASPRSNAQEYGRQWADERINVYTEQQVRALLATATAPTEPFGYFKAEPFGWTDCGPDDEGAVALYEKPQAMLATGGQAQADARDAGRYRWLRKSPNPACDIGLAKHFACGRGEDFEALIDAAIAAAKGE